MNNAGKRPPWMEDESLQNIDPRKLDFLGKLFTEGKGKSQKEMMTFMMQKMKQAKSEKINFSSAEVSAVITAIKNHSTPEELAQIENIMKKAPH